MTETITLIVFLSPWAILLVWELVLLFMRWRYPDKPVKTISMVARDYGYKLSSVVYAWCGMAGHWWWNADNWGAAWAGITFWVILIGLLVWDILDWKSPPRRTWWKSPLFWGAVGLVAGRFLFPQAGAGF